MKYIFLVFLCCLIPYKIVAASAGLYEVDASDDKPSVRNAAPIHDEFKRFIFVSHGYTETPPPDEIGRKFLQLLRTLKKQEA